MAAAHRSTRLHGRGRKLGGSNKHAADGGLSAWVSHAQEPGTLKAELLSLLHLDSHSSPVVLPQRALQGLDRACTRPLIWLAAVPGAGKSTLARGYARLRHRPCLWLRVEDGEGAFHGQPRGDSDAHILAILAVLTRGLAALCGLPPAELPQPPADTPLALRDAIGRLFEAAAASLPQHALLVLDDVDAQGRTLRHVPLFIDLLEMGLCRLPPGRNALVLSRAPAPPVLAVLRSQGLATMLDAQALALCPDEIRQLALQHGHRELAPQTLAFMQQASAGWAAGLALLLEQPLLQVGVMPTEAVYGYFAGTVLPYLPVALLRMFDELARLRTITPALVEGLHPGADGAATLDDLCRDHGFVARCGAGDADAGTGPAYALHPMFRDALQQHALRTLGAHRLRDMDRRIAAALWTQGREDEAAELWLQHGLHAELMRRLPTIFPDWLSAPQLRRAQAWMRPRSHPAGRAQPWLDCWDGLCRVAQTPAEARELLQRAYPALTESGDALGAMGALIGIIESFINQWGDFHPLDRWIPEMSRLLEAGLKLPEDVVQRAQLALFMAMMYRQPGNPGLAPLADVMQDLAERCLHQPLRAYAAAQLLLYQCWWRGDMAAGRLVAELAPGLEAGAQHAPAVRIAWLAVQSIYGGLMITDTAQATAQLDTALALAKRSHVHLWDSLLLGQILWCSLTTGHLDVARIQVRRMARSLQPRRHLDHSYYHCLNAVLALHDADLAAMRAHAQAALRFAREAGVPWAEGVVLCAVARGQALQGDASAARISLDEAERLASSIASDTVHFDVLLARLELGFDQEQGRTGADATLAAWMQLWRRCGFHNFPWWRSEVVARLCARALEQDIETAFVRKIIRARRLLPPQDQPVPQAWPLSLHISVIDRFSITLDGRSVAASGKIPKKPLELLKLIIAQGGLGRRTELATLLWPHLDDAAGEQVLKVTLHRLRKLIGHDALLCHAGAVALDTHRCHVDLLEFFAMLERVEVAPAQHGNLLLALLRQHAGGVFTEDSGAEWAAAVRASLRRRLLLALHAGLASWRAAGAWERVLACGQFGLTLDAHDEACHLGLIEACVELDRPQDARAAQATYLHCIDRMPAANATAFAAAIPAPLDLPIAPTR